MSTVEVHPNKGLGGQFVLGELLFSINEKIQEANQKSTFVYSEKNSSQTPILVNLLESSTRLMFNSHGEQQLILIEILDFQNIKLVYKGMYLNDIIHHCPTDEELAKASGSGDLAHIRGKKRVVPPTLKEIYNTIFGPTYPGKLFRPSKVYILSYPGIAFRFQILLEDLLSQLLAQDDETAILSKLTNWDNAKDILCTSVAVFKGENFFSYLEQISGPTPITLPRNNSILIDKVHVQLSTGRLTINFTPECEKAPQIIEIGKSRNQDVLRVLGPPDACFHKFDSRLQIHESMKSNTGDPHSPTSVYKFHNYFRFGIDFLYNLDSASRKGGVLKKVILHDGGDIKSRDFMKWGRCKWEITNDETGRQFSITSDMLFESMKEKMSQAESLQTCQPVLLNRHDSQNMNEFDMEFVSSADYDEGEKEYPEINGTKLITDIKIWGQLRLYGYQRCIWDVNESNNCVTSVTLY